MHRRDIVRDGGRNGPAPRGAAAGRVAVAAGLALLAALGSAVRAAADEQAKARAAAERQPAAQAAGAATAQAAGATTGPAAREALRVVADERLAEALRAIAAEYTRRTGAAVSLQFLSPPEVEALAAKGAAGCGAIFCMAASREGPCKVADLPGARKVV